VFVLTLVIFNDRLEAARADLGISDLRISLDKNARFEFKFNKMKDADCRFFLENVSQYGFVFYAMVINKAALHAESLSYSESFYEYVCSLAFENARHLLERAVVVIDGSGSREFKQQLQTYLKRKINDESAAIPCIHKVKIEDSKTNNLLQLADMICGAVARCYRVGDESFRSLIKEREGYVQFWPK